METATGGHPWREVLGVFLRLGCTAFGGPAAHVAWIEAEVVRRRGWVTREEFLDLWSVTQLIPGPNSTELALLLGLRRAGWRGFLAAGLGFIAPAVLLVGGLAWAYVRFGRLPALQGVFYGLKPVLIVIVAQSVWSLARPAWRTPWTAGIGGGAAVLHLSGVGELPVLLLAGGLGWLRTRWRGAGGGMLAVGGWPGWELPAGAGAGLGAAGATLATPFSLTGLFGVFLKVGAVLYGSGYVLLAFLRTDLVEQRGWLTEGQLLDAVAVGQFTPGPLFTTATFIGYLLGGWPGAGWATVGIFLPSFVLVAVSGAWVSRLRAWPATSALLDGVNAASVALMGVVTIRLGMAGLVDGPTAVVAGLAGVLLLTGRVQSVWVMLGAAMWGGWYRT
jgi:chromate transporter